jgi:hypothetical protein
MFTKVPFDDATKDVDLVEQTASHFNFKAVRHEGSYSDLASAHSSSKVNNPRPDYARREGYARKP